MKDSLLIGTLGLLPKNALSRMVGALAHAPLPSSLGQLSIRAFARMYNISFDELAEPLENYKNLGDFFVRRLKPEARPIDDRPESVVSPSDGHVLNFGRFEDGCFLQAKGRNYTISSLLQDEAAAERFAEGSWLTIYLSPQDYHRVHHPVEGQIKAARYIPGQLWPVNRAGVQHVDGLFCVNERVVTYVDSPLGELAIVMVGATSVGHITMAYDSGLESNRSSEPGDRVYEGIPVARGDELGVFHLGSTVILLFANPQMKLEALEEGQAVRMGQRIAFCA